MCLLQQTCFAQQQPPADSVKALTEVVMKAFEQSKAGYSRVVVKTVHTNDLDRYNKTSFVNSFNTVAGVRMEERSPGSYRINIRGSSLRSPFGVRNVKVYWNDVPVTDAGGNTYFNQFAYPNFNTIEIVKGPAGSMYGAGTGGLLLMQTFDNSWKPTASIQYVTGSYGLQNILSSISFGKKENRNLLTYSHNQTNGYRYHSRSNKDNLSFNTQYKIGDQQLLSVNILYCHLFYETPGGLNISEYKASPKLARPAAGAFPSAETAKAAIDQTTFLTGITHQVNFTRSFKNSTTVYGNFSQIKNPTFRNYEQRSEPGFGGRTSFVLEQAWSNTQLKWTLGAEWQRGFFNTQVSKNKMGNPDTLQTDDVIQFTTGLVFAQADLSIGKKWFINAGASINRSAVDFTRLNSYPVQQQHRVYSNEWAPRLSLKKRFGNDDEVFMTVSKGFSPPTIAELLPSTGIISTFLEAESGTNYELGSRLFFFHKKLVIDAGAFYFRLNNALVLRKDNNNADYFVNAGNIKQQGIEISPNYLVSFSNKFIDYLSLKAAYTFSHFKYGNYQKAATDLSGNKLPGVPKHTVSITADILTSKGWYFSSTGYFASHVFLNDENTIKANDYLLLGCRAGWVKTTASGRMINIYAGSDNLLNQQYSLGLDINAAAGRYYNAAPSRNYYLGVSFQLPVMKKNNRK
jgi:iron complex outermembrane receptor protein